MPKDKKTITIHVPLRLQWWNGVRKSLLQCRPQINLNDIPTSTDQKLLTMAAVDEFLGKWTGHIALLSSERFETRKEAKTWCEKQLQKRYNENTN